jgi:hypothetical protein
VFSAFRAANAFTIFVHIVRISFGLDVLQFHLTCLHIFSGLMNCVLLCVSAVFSPIISLCFNVQISQPYRKKFFLETVL